MNQALIPPQTHNREALHNEIHAHPPARITLPALVIQVAVVHANTTRDEQIAHLRQLDQHASFNEKANFLRMSCNGGSIKWERHSEYSRYAVLQPLPQSIGFDCAKPDVFTKLIVPHKWLASIPGETIVATVIGFEAGDIPNQYEEALARARHWLGVSSVAASIIGAQKHSLVASDLQIREDGFEYIAVVSHPNNSPTRIGRIAQRIAELEIYRILALRSHPYATELFDDLAKGEQQLAEYTNQLKNAQTSDQTILNNLTLLASDVEDCVARNTFRFDATKAYHDIVEHRLAELQETHVQSGQTIGDYIRRRYDPAITTIVRLERRLVNLSHRIVQSTNLLRTRIDTSIQTNNQMLLARLSKGQELQLRLQTTVEGLSIAAISYYVISLIGYGTKALEDAGIHVATEQITGASIPLVVVSVWLITRHIHHKITRATSK